MYVYMHMWVHIHVCVHAHVGTHTCMYPHVGMHTLCVHVCVTYTRRHAGLRAWLIGKGLSKEGNLQDLRSDCWYRTDSSPDEHYVRVPSIVGRSSS